MTNTTRRNNPLLIGEGLPPFHEIRTDQIVLAITELIENLDFQLTNLETNVTPTWEGLVEPLTEIEERLRWSWGIVEHLMSVKNSQELRKAYEQSQPYVVQFTNKINQSQFLYKAFKALQNSEVWNTLGSAQKRIVETAIREAELAGVGLEGEKRERFNQIQLELAELSTKFSNNVFDATKAFRLKLKTKKEVDGLPASLLSLAAQTARSEGEENATPEAGPWVITLDYPSYVPFLKYSSQQDLREKVYKAFLTRASKGHLDNNPLIEQILELRKEKAQLLGYNTYAEVSLARKMAPDVETVEKLLEELRQVSYKAAVQDLKTLKTFAKTDNLKHWDISFWAEKQREIKFNFTAEELRPYFPLPQVLKGLFTLAQRIFQVTITPADGQAPVWHKEVRYFQVRNELGEAIASFYLDPYSRPLEKREGAWMNDCIGRAKIQTDGRFYTRLPVAYLICNQTPPVGKEPSLMTFNEVTTLFHEFGHGLQHMLTQVDYPGASGINNVEWDAVELPSQFMENWCYDRHTLFNIAKHYKTGETLPEHFYQKLVAARNYMSGSSMLRQLHFSFLDLELHYRYNPNKEKTTSQVRDRISQKTMVMKPLPEDSFLCTFCHIFSGGYAAGYYSYKWAEVLSADAFAAFEEVGLKNEKAIIKVGQKFRDTVLALGGSVHPMEVFKTFRGREPKTESLLKHRGLL
ncbi:M3 family metallopeptidase [cyanobacterium endosymbiont of Epithemia clementina EcSB]|uniref:M3 family metallopeptidase n=1 Tax=cyanobacterium endosymbiont of Epithemia clementina EcSB TaxID=3034674 RepID=UPI00247FC76D|nr:M3 family metallopeptidase [cyanobacterium endosymbiont of Epithemia clementina EcSB]WGT68346.1 M3 family metallopeptidase [cyanobacterium endosymbiont of Epithemia clementina EcSB]